MTPPSPTVTATIYALLGFIVGILLVGYGRAQPDPDKCRIAALAYQIVHDSLRTDFRGAEDSAGLTNAESKGVEAAYRTSKALGVSCFIVGRNRRYAEAVSHD